MDLSIRKIIIAVAPVGTNMPEGVKNPLTPQEVAEETTGCAKAGASMVHLHVRDSAGNQTADLTEFAGTLTLIREKSDIIIQGSTGGVSNLSLEERCVSLNDPRVEVASLNMGSSNFDEGVYINTLPDIRYWAKRMREANIMPELEIFEAGMINNVKILADEGVLEAPFNYGFCLGFRGALPASADNLYFLKSLIPSDAAWGFTHHGMRDLSLLATAIGMGAGIVRVGFEDSVYWMPGKVAESNVELVEKIASLVNLMGMEVATAEDTREILGVS